MKEQEKTLSTRYYSKRQEKAVAKSLNGRRTANSGATAFQKGDVVLVDWLIECKTSTNFRQSASISKKWIDKNAEEAFAMGKHHSAVAFNYGPDEPNYYVISEKEFKRLLEID